MARTRLTWSSTSDGSRLATTNMSLRELRDVVEAADEWPVKVILETCLLTGGKIHAAGS